MKTQIAYGKTGLDVELPDVPFEMVEPKFIPGLPDEAQALRDALRNPIESKALREIASSSDTIGIIFSDITRPTPYTVILPVLLSELDHIPDRQILLFNATGTHRKNTETELRAMLGGDVIDRFEIIQNEALDDDSHVHIGTTTSGNKIRIHRRFMDCDIRIPTGFIEPHLMAGFSGGGKAIMPGIASMETIMNNHSAVNVDHPNVNWGERKANPVLQEIVEAVSMVGYTFLLNVTLNREKRITAVFAGDFHAAHELGCGFVREHAMVGVSHPFDIIVTSNSGYPLDLNLYQSVKGMSAASLIVKNGGDIIIAADCWDGIPNGSEYEKMLGMAASPEELLDLVRRPGFHRPEMWQAQIHAKIILKSDVHFYSENLTDDQIAGALLKPCHDISKTVAELVKLKGENTRICVLPEGPQTIPYLL